MRAFTSFSMGAALAAGVLSGACGSVLGPPAAASANVIDTVTLYAASGTPVGTPSAYDIEINERVRTDTTPLFDFLFDMPGTTAKFFPPGSLPGLTRTSALQYAASFDGTTTAPPSGWNDTTALTVSNGTVVLVHSRLITCAYGASVFQYAKLQVLAIDTLARTIQFQILSNTNCGYRDLNPGLPKH
jgi:hypothetical protein